MACPTSSLLTARPTICYRRSLLDERSDLIRQIMTMAKKTKVLKVDNISFDDMTIGANGRRHRALSHGHTEKREVQSNSEVQELLAPAEQADRADLPDGVD